MASLVSPKNVTEFIHLNVKYSFYDVTTTDPLLVTVEFKIGEQKVINTQSLEHVKFLALKGLMSKSLESNSPSCVFNGIAYNNFYGVDAHISYEDEITKKNGLFTI